MKPNRKGFTLVELLVVMAIIAILASIAIPNVVSYIRSARATNAIAEISSIETALTKMLADSNRSSLHQLFNPQAIRNTVGAPSGQFNANQFAAAQAVYSNAFYVLLRQGRGALNAGSDVAAGVTVNYGNILNQSVVSRLGSSYLDLGLDPWGNLYQIFPGPWPAANGPNIHRVYRRDTASTLPGQGGGAGTDALTISNLPDPDDLLGGSPGSFPADRNKIAFIYSYGANLISGQAVYQPGGQYPGGNTIEEKSVYFRQQEPAFMGGGDDINNWDRDRSWERFYN